MTETMKALHALLFGQNWLIMLGMVYLGYVLHKIAEKQGVKFDIFIRLRRNGDKDKTE